MRSLGRFPPLALRDCGVLGRSGWGNSRDRDAHPRLAASGQSLAHSTGHAKGPRNVTLVQFHGRIRVGGTFAFGNGFAFYGGPWNYPLFSPFPTFYGYPYVLPPVMLPPGSLYGPEAVANFVAGPGNLGMGDGQAAPLPKVRINPPAAKDGRAPMD